MAIKASKPSAMRQIGCGFCHLSVERSMPRIVSHPQVDESLKDGARMVPGLRTGSEPSPVTGLPAYSVRTT